MTPFDVILESLREQGYTEVPFDIGVDLQPKTFHMERYRSCVTLWFRPNHDPVEINVVSYHDGQIMGWDTGRQDVYD